RERLPADVDGRGVEREMHAHVESVGGDDQMPARGYLQDRGVIADAENDVIARERAGADALDEVEFQDAPLREGRLPGTRRANLGRAPLGGGMIEHAVDVGVAVLGAEALDRLDRLVD